MSCDTQAQLQHTQDNMAFWVKEKCCLMAEIKSLPWILNLARSYFQCHREDLPHWVMKLKINQTQHLNYDFVQLRCFFHTSLSNLQCKTAAIEDPHSVIFIWILLFREKKQKEPRACSRGGVNQTIFDEDPVWSVRSFSSQVLKV